MENITTIVSLIGLIVALVFFIVKAVKGKKWNVLVSLVLDLMMEAEQQFSSGAEKKQWVMGMVAASAKKIGYDIDVQKLSDLIDDLCKMSKNVNVKH